MRPIALAVALAAIGVTARAADSGFQQYLIPIIANSVPGAFGSVWQTEWTVSNTGTGVLIVQAPLCSPQILSCSHLPVGVQPDGEERPVLYPQQPAPNVGAFIYVSNDEATSFTTELRVRDLSQQSQSWGAEVPVVNTTELRDSIRLLDVPADSTFRVLLRIYGLIEPLPNVVHVRVQTSAGKALLEQSVPLAGNVNPPGVNPPVINYTPAYAQLAIPAGTSGDKLRIDVTSTVPGQPIWAFASITNNSTQELTLVTPQPIPKQAAPPATLAFGHWGGSHACLDVTHTTTIVRDPRADTITFITPTVDANGHFEADGYLLACDPGPALQPVMVHISGDVRGGTVTITISSPRTPDPLTLEFGSEEPCSACTLV